MKKTRDGCRFCRKEIPQGALFCPWCGEKQIGPKKAAPKYPAFRVLADGSLLGQLMVDGQRTTVKAATEEEYRARIDALRTGVLELKRHPEKRTLESVLRAYIDKNDGVLSPATIRGYEIIYNNRFKSCMKKRVCDIDFQEMIQEEVRAKRAPKSTRNAWGLVSSSFRAAGIPVPDVNLPAVPESDGDFLDYEQIQTFLAAIRGDKAETAALLMLHSLRMSELRKLTADQVGGGMIHVRGAIVQGKDNKPVEKQTNKNRTSRRDIPIMIPRLEDLIPASGPVVTIAPTTMQRRIKDVCRACGLPECSPHDLRRSFASLAKHLGWSPDTLKAVGGWSNMETVNRIYAKLAQQDKNKDIENMRNYYEITTSCEKSANSAPDST